MAITYEQGLACVQGFAAAIAENKEYVPQLDSEIGDADRGTNMDRGMQAVLPKVGSLEGADFSQLFKTPTMTISEVIGTLVLVLVFVFGVLAITSNAAPGAPGLTPLLVGLLVFAIGLSLGGPTGYAINPARDLGPRIAHFILRFASKGTSDWEYAWVPVVAPIVGDSRRSGGEGVFSRHRRGTHGGT